MLCCSLPLWPAPLCRGNLIYSGGPEASLGIEHPEWGGSGCAPGNPTCTAALVLEHNAVDTLEPQLRDPGAGDFRCAAPGQLIQLLPCRLLLCRS